MAIMVGIVGALSAFYHDSMDLNNQNDRYTSAIRLIAKMPTLAALSYKYSIGLPYMYPQNKMSYADAFAAALAKVKKADLVTGDNEFKPLDGEIKISWI